MIPRTKNIHYYQRPLGSKLLQPHLAVPIARKKYNTVIFDLGNVLIEWQPMILVPQLFPDQAEVACSIVKALVNDPLWYEFDRGTVTITDLATHGEKAYHFNPDLTANILSTIPHHIPAVPEIVSLFLELQAKGYKTYFLTNMSEPFFEVLLKQHSFMKQSHGIIASYAIKKIKPELAIYEYLLQHFNIKPEEALFIDDLEQNIAAGNHLGIDGIVCKNKHEALEIIADMKLLSPHDNNTQTVDPVW